jgi:probable HAF family extracellular repeat protein
MHLRTISGLALALALLASHADAQDSYRLTKIEGLSRFGDVNDRGVVVGATQAANGAQHAAIWRNGHLTDLHDRISSGAVESGLRDINGKQDVVGTFIDSTEHGFLIADGHLTPIAPLAGDTFAVVTRLNDRKQILGGSFDNTTGLSRQFVWHRGRFTVLRGLAGQSHSIEPNDIGNGGLVVGTDNLAQRAVAWRNAAIVDLGGLPGSQRNEAAAINDVGQIVGRSLLSSPDEFPQQVTAFIWDDGAVTALPPLFQGVTASFVHDINNFGVVAGASLPEGAEQTIATIWQGGVSHDLNQLISADDPLKSTVTLQDAAAVNNRGQIVASARAADGFSTDFYLLTPTGEAAP